jgi:hypothetical protein
VVREFWFIGDGKETTDYTDFTDTDKARTAALNVIRKLVEEEIQGENLTPFL